MGEVYRARDVLLDREVALKVLRIEEGEGQDASGRERIFREARAAASLEHPNIVAVYDVGEITGRPGFADSAYLAMELVRGTSLRAHVLQPSPPLGEKLRWLVAIARALEAAHARGIVHRDIKPENVMIRDDGELKVLDFGIARRLFAPAGNTSTVGGQIVPTLTAGGAVVGTPAYMAPEQMRGEVLDGRTDQFAWGVVAYELLCAKKPWSDDRDALQLVSEMLSTEPTPPAQRNPEIPAQFSAAITRALSKSKAARFPTMAALIKALEESGPESPATRHPRRLNKRFALSAFSVAGAIALAVLIGRRTSGPAPDTKPAVAGSASAPGCSSNAQCVEAHGGVAHVCRDGTCVGLASQDCTVSAEPEDLLAEDTVWVGTMFPLKGENAKVFGTSNAQAVELARRDFAEIMRGFRAGGSALVHPIAVVSCDDSMDPKRAAHHLVERVGVSAVIGFYSSAEAVELASSTFLPARVLTIASLNASPLVTRVPQPPGEPRLVWRTTYSTATTARALAALVEQIFEPRVRAVPGAIMATRPLRVAVVRPANQAGIGLAQAFFASARFNSKSALENGEDFRELAIDDGNAKSADAVVDALVEFSPHVIVYNGYSAVLRSVIAPLEARWRGTLAYRPLYASGTGFSADTFDWLGHNTSLMRRLFATTVVSTTINNARFVVHYNDSFDDKVTRTVAPNSSYDAFYVVALASYAVGKERATGPALARAIPRLLPPGVRIDVGTAGIFDAYAALRGGQQVDLNGATSTLDFDLATGEVAIDQAILCVAPDEHGAAHDALESGLVFDAVKERFVGKMRCP
jgi:serine/threonine-protein kinase